MRILQKIIYWAISLTWGAVLTIPGLLVAAFCCGCFETTIHDNGYGIIVEIGGDWGGFNMGPVSFCGHYWPDEWFEHTRRHEFGHSLQHLIFGPLQIFIVIIPSVIRYWYRRLNPQKAATPYDSVWYEGMASKWGYKAINAIENVEFEYVPET